VRVTVERADAVEPPASPAEAGPAADGAEVRRDR
jgi:hypothetical protein